MKVLAEGEWRGYRWWVVRSGSSELPEACEVWYEKGERREYVVTTELPAEDRVRDVLDFVIDRCEEGE